LPRSVIPEANTIQLPTQQACLWAENSGVGVSKWPAETMGIWQEKWGLTTQWMDNQVRECIWKIILSIIISNKLGDSPKK